jgi:hypothetical protein
MIYLIRKNGMVLAHTDLAAMKALDGIETPEMTITEAAWNAAECLARIIDGEIFLGKTEAEKQDEANRRRMAAIDRELEAINKKAARSVQAITAATARGDPPEAADAGYLEGYEAEAAALREERRTLAGN